MAKIWETKAGAGVDPFIDEFLSSVQADSRLLREDLEGSLAHAAMLGRTGIIPEATAAALAGGLSELAALARAGSLAVDPGAEDVHSFVEAELTRRLGDAGRSLHAGRSRNDQVALDLRLWMRRASGEVSATILDAIDALCALASRGLTAVMPGYTHMQRAQAVTFAHHLLAWCAALERDHGRFADAEARADECPLGACALAGTGLPIDRELCARELGFARPSRNSMDAVADRDAAVEFASCAATLLMHLSRFCEEIVLWASSEFGFVRVGPSCSTGSSVMPQKRNPDPAELIRGKSGRAYGSLVALLVMQKGLPLAYDRDLQEDKALVFEAGDTALSCLRAFCLLVASLEPQAGRMRDAAESGCLWAADAAEFLVSRGIPFRTAYAAGRALVEAWVRAAEGGGFGRNPAIAGVIAALGEAGLAGLHPAWAGVSPGELVPYLSLEACIARRDLVGGPAPARTASEIGRLAAFTKSERGRTRDRV